MKTVLMEEMTSPQIKQALENGYKTVIVAAGAIEQHGKHLPIGMDTMGGYVMAERLARALGRTLVAPVIRPGCSDHHMSFAGTLSVSTELLQELVRAYCRCLAQHGFESIVLLPSHGGNIAAMEAIAPVLDAELSCKVAWVNVSRNSRKSTACEPILKAYGISPEEGGIHSGFVETSLLLGSRFGHLVEMRLAEAGFVGDCRTAIDKATDAQGHWNIAEISPIGVLGDPTKATADAGEALHKALTPVYADLVREALGWTET